MESEGSRRKEEGEVEIKRRMMENEENKQNIQWEAERKGTDNKPHETQPTWFWVAPASTGTWPWHRLYPSHSWLSCGCQRSMSGWSVCGCSKCLATTDTVKVIHPGWEEHHLFTLIRHSDCHWEDVQLTHTHTHMGCIYSTQISITSFMCALITQGNTVYRWCGWLGPKIKGVALHPPCWQLGERLICPIKM